MTKKQRAISAVEALKKEYPEAICSLNYKDEFQLLAATRLSAQCTDARVNIVTPALFEKYPTVEAFAEAEVADVEELIRSCGFYRTKAKDLVEMAKKIEEMTGIETRATVLGYIQRGGSPTVRDRVMASQMGGKAVELLANGIGNRVIAFVNNQIKDFDILEGLSMKKTIDMDQYELFKILSL